MTGSVIFPKKKLLSAVSFGLSETVKGGIGMKGKRISISTKLLALSLIPLILVGVIALSLIHI